VVEPLGGLIEQKVDEGSKELQCIKTTLLASMQGYAPQVAVEFGARSCTRRTGRRSRSSRGM
jgi:Flagellar motor component